jgi:choline dehydrogenase-like flavoprotein
MSSRIDTSARPNASADIVILGAGYGGLHVAQRLVDLLAEEQREHPPVALRHPIPEQREQQYHRTFHAQQPTGVEHVHCGIPFPLHSVDGLGAGEALVSASKL